MKFTLSTIALASFAAAPAFASSSFTTSTAQHNYTSTAAGTYYSSTASGAYPVNYTSTATGAYPVNSTSGGAYPVNSTSTIQSNGTGAGYTSINQPNATATGSGTSPNNTLGPNNGTSLSDHDGKNFAVGLSMGGIEKFVLAGAAVQAVVALL